MRLLFAEDEISMSEAVVDILTYNHYQVDAVYNGEDALSYALVQQYDGIILDIMMPKMDGFEVLSSGDLTLSPYDFQLACGEKTMTLSKLEYQLMEMFSLSCRERFTFVETATVFCSSSQF